MTSPGDPLVLGSRTDGGPDRYRFHTADGVPDADAFCPGELLALEHCWERDLGCLRTVDSRYGVVGVVLAEQTESMEITASHARSAALCERNVAENGVEGTVSVDTGLATVDRSADGQSDRDSTATSNTSSRPSRRRADGGRTPEADTAVYVPRAYDPLELGRRRLLTALDGLAPDGTLFVAARPETGLSRYESLLADVAATLSSVASRDDWVLLRAKAPGQVALPDDPPFDWIRDRVGGCDLSLVTAPGLFAPSALDDGTRLLAETATVTDGDSLLDLCCGYGALGAYAGSVADCEVWCSDDDALATACARRTLAANGVDGRVVTADCVAGVENRQFDTVLCNPPTHAGDGVLAELFDGARSVLAPGGRAWFVHHRALDLSRHTRVFDRVEPVATGPEHVVKRATR